MLSGCTRKIHFHGNTFFNLESSLHNVLGKEDDVGLRAQELSCVRHNCGCDVNANASRMLAVMEASKDVMVHSFNTSLEQAPGAMCNRTCSNNKPKHCAQKSNKLQDAHHTAQLTLPSGLHV
eukprot:1161327-Pelagomonas_calceolata.AAC.4